MATDALSDFGATLRRLRDKRGLTQQQLGDRTVGVSSSYVARLELNQRRPSVETVAALASALKCSRAERAELEAARELTFPDDAERLAAPGGVRSAAQTMAGVASKYDALMGQVRKASKELEAEWAGSSSAAYTDCLEEWETHVVKARDALVRMADALQIYAEQLEAVDRAVAERLRG